MTTDIQNDWDWCYICIYMCYIQFKCIHLGALSQYEDPCVVRSVHFVCILIFCNFAYFTSASDAKLGGKRSKTKTRQSELIKIADIKLWELLSPIKPSIKSRLTNLAQNCDRTHSFFVCPTICSVALACRLTVHVSWDLTDNHPPASVSAGDDIKRRVDLMRWRDSCLWRSPAQRLD